MPSASQQGGKEEVKTWQVEPGGVGGVLGLGGKFLFSLFTFTQEVCFQSLVSQFLDELNGRRCLGESESFVFFVFSCCILLSVLDTVL